MENIFDNSNENFFINQTENKEIEIEDLRKYLVELKEKEKDLEYEKRSNRSKIINSFNTGYFSPTFIKSFAQCPARCFYNKAIEEEKMQVTNVGSAVHKVCEDIVKDSCFYDKKKIDEIISKNYDDFSIDKMNQSKIKVYYDYINNFLKYDDYLGGKMNWGKVQSFPELFLKDENLRVMDVDLGACYTLIDRLDIRPEGIYIIDYKTGRMTETKMEFISNYISQAIAYSWIVEVKYGQKVSGVYFHTLEDNNYIKMPVDDLIYQSMFIDDILKFYEDIKDQNRRKVFDERVNKYCRYCILKDKCNAYNSTNNAIKIDIKLKQN